MQIAIVGTGYVGLVSGACLADFGHEVVCIDTDAARIEALRRGEMPFFEPGLEELIQRHAASGRLRFTSDLGEGVRDALVIFLAVGTPAAPGGEADLSQITAAALALCPLMDRYRVIATKSTVPVGTGDLIRDLLTERLGPEAEFDIVSNPEFLREGAAIADFLRPDRVVIGASSERANEIMREIYRPLYLIETPLVFTTVQTAEMIKYASNGFLAVKVGFINEIANLCDAVEADVHVVARAMGLDKRIGSKFLHPGPGYGGSCFPKDTTALAELARRHGVAMDIVSAAIVANDRQRAITIEKIARATGGSVARRVAAVLGLAFKPNTSDIRESPAWKICQDLAAAGARVRAYDPAAMGEAARAMKAGARAVELLDDAYSAARDADVLVIATEWNEFRALDLERLKAVMRRPAIVDTRNVLDPARVRALGFTYLSTGRGAFGDLTPARPHVRESVSAAQVR